MANVTFVPTADLPPCSVSLAWWPQDTALVAELAAVANEVRAEAGLRDAATPGAGPRAARGHRLPCCFALQLTRAMPAIIQPSRGRAAGTFSQPGRKVLASPIPGSTSSRGPKNVAKSSGECRYSLEGPSLYRRRNCSA